MPHVVFNKKIEFTGLEHNFQPIFEKDPSIIKITDVYINKARTVALLPTINTENHQEFMIEISTRENKTTIRLYPQTDPEKTDSVKKSLSLVALLVQKSMPESSVSKTNIIDYLDKESLKIDLV